MNRKIITTPNAPKPIGAYNQAIIHQGMLYTSGQIAIDPKTGELVLDDIETETRQVMENLNAILRAASIGFDEVIKATIFLSAMELFTEVNKVYANYFKEEIAPVRETVAVAELPKSVHVEISLIAFVI